MQNLKIYPEEQHLTEYHLIKNLILLKFQNLMDNKELLPECFFNFFAKKLASFADKSAACGAVKSDVMSN